MLTCLDITMHTSRQSAAADTALSLLTDLGKLRVVGNSDLSDAGERQ